MSNSVISATIKEINTGSINFSPLFFIKDKNGLWVNFSEMARWPSINGLDRLVDVGSVILSIEKELEQLQSSVQSITLDNFDSLFDRILPDTIRAMDIATGSPPVQPLAVFDKSYGYYESVLVGRQCQVGIVLSVSGASYAGGVTTTEAKVEYILGTYIIDDIQTDHSSNVASLKLSGLQTKLIEVDAGKIKDGISWYVNRPASFLISEIVKLVFRKVGTNELPDGFNIKRVLNIPTLDNSLVPAILGQSPEFDAVNNIWRNDGFLTRAIVWHNGYLYAGCDGEIWRYDPTLDTWIPIDTTTLDSAESGAKVRWMESDGTTIWGVAHSDVRQITWSPVYTILFFKIVSDVVTILPSSEGRVMSGLHTMRFGTLLSGDGEGIYPANPDPNYATSAYIYKVGNDVDDTADLPEQLSTPFAQSVISGFEISPSYIFWQLLQPTPIAVINLHVNSFGAAGSKVTTEARIVQKSFYFSRNESRMIDPSKYVGVFFSMGQSYQFVRIDNYIYGFKINMPSDYGIPGTAVEMKLFRNNTSDGTKVYYTFPHTDNLHHTYPVCITNYEGAARRIMISVMKWSEKNFIPTTKSKNYLQLFNSDLTMFAEYDFFSGATGDDQYWTVVDMIQTPSPSLRFFAILYNRKKQNYAVIKTIIFDWNSIVWIKVTPNPIQNLYYDSKTDKIYFFESGGKIQRIVNNDLSTDYEYLFDGDPVVSGEAQMLSNFASNPNADTLEMYGISSPTFDPLNFESTPAGRYLLFRVSTNFSDRIQLADFKDKDGWAIIKKICQATRSIAGFDENGNFFYLPRDPTLGTVLTLGSITIFSAVIIGSTNNCYVRPLTSFISFSLLNMGNNGLSSVDAGYRFQNITIPKDSVITSAYITFRSNVTLSTTICNLSIKGEASDDPIAFSTYADFAARPVGSAQVLWNNLGAWTLSQYYDSPDISSVIQEIVNRAGWAEGNDLVIFVNDNGSSVGVYRSTRLVESVLHVQYQPLISSEGGADFVIGENDQDPESIKAVSLKKSRAPKTIFNVVKLIPGAIKDNPPSVKLTIAPRTGDEYTTKNPDLAFSPFDVDQRDNLTKTLAAICVSEGRLRTTTDNYSANSYQLFKYSVFREEIELYLRGNYVAASLTLNVSSIYAAYDNRDEQIPEIGDYVAATRSDLVIEYREITNILSTVAFTLSSGFTENLDDGAVVTVVKTVKVDSTGTSSKWSDEGIAYLTVNATANTLTLNDVRQLSVGCMIAFGTAVTDRQQSVIGYKVLTIDSETKIVTVSGLTTNLPTSGTKVRSYFCPLYYDQFYEVGGANIFMKFKKPQAPDIENETYTGTFKMGDMIRADCPGLTLEADETSKQVAMDTVSMNRYGRQEYSSITNEFWSPRFALEVAKTLISKYKDPKYEFDIEVPFSPFMTLVKYDGSITIYEVFSPRLLPLYTENRILCTALQIQHDLKNALTTLKLRAISSY